MVQNPISCV